jgi:hypothetical protein
VLRRRFPVDDNNNNAPVSVCGVRGVCGVCGVCEST